MQTEWIDISMRYISRYEYPDIFLKTEHRSEVVDRVPECFTKMSGGKNISFGIFRFFLTF